MNTMHSKPGERTSETFELIQNYTIQHYDELIGAADPDDVKVYESQLPLPLVYIIREDGYTISLMVTETGEIERVEWTAWHSLEEALGHIQMSETFSAMGLSPADLGL